MSTSMCHSVRQRMDGPVHTGKGNDLQTCRSGGRVDVSMWLMLGNQEIRGVARVLLESKRMVTCPCCWRPVVVACYRRGCSGPEASEAVEGGDVLSLHRPRSYFACPTSRIKVVSPATSPDECQISGWHKQVVRQAGTSQKEANFARDRSSGG